MFPKRLLILLPAAFFIFSFANSAKAEFFSVSAGLPISYTFSNTDTDAPESDGVTGTMLHVKLPVMVGFGLETYSVKIKGDGDAKFDATMFDVFYLFPIPIVNITLGLGIGSSEVICDLGGGSTCSDAYEKATPTQVYGQFGFPIFGPVDLHLSYHSVSSTMKGKNGNSDLDLGGNMLALGASFTF